MIKRLTVRAYFSDSFDSDMARRDLVELLVEEALSIPVEAELVSERMGEDFSHWEIVFEVPAGEAETVRQTFYYFLGHVYGVACHIESGD